MESIEVSYNKIKFSNDLSKKMIKDLMRKFEEMLLGKGLPYLSKVSLVSFKEKDGYIENSGTTIDSLLTNLENTFLIQDEEYIENKKVILEPNRTYKASDIFGVDRVLIDNEIITTLADNVDIIFEIRPSFSATGDNHINNYSKYTVERYTTPTILYYSLYPYVMIKKKDIEKREIQLRYDNKLNKSIFIELLNKVFSKFSDIEIRNSIYKVSDYKIENLIDLVELPNAKPAFKKIKEYYYSEYIEPKPNSTPQQIQSHYYDMMFSIFFPSSDLSIETMRMKVEYDVDDIDEIELYDRVVKRVLTRIGVGDARVNMYSKKIREVLKLV